MVRYHYKYKRLPTIGDSIIDNGSTDNVFPSNLKIHFSKFKEKIGKLYCGNNASLKTLGRGTFGVLTNILLCDGITLPLISARFLIKNLKYKIYHDDDRVFILKQIKNTNNIDFKINTKLFRTVATATLDPNDRLFHIDDMNCFLKEEPKVSKAFGPMKSIESIDNNNNIIKKKVKFIKTNSNKYKDKNKSNLPKEAPEADISAYTKKQMKMGSNRVMIKSLRQYLNLLEWLHVRLGHINPELIKWMIRKMVVLGAGVTWADIEKETMGVCDACLHSHMHALPIYSSLTKRIYSLFEYLTCDYIPFGFKTIRGYTGAIIYMCKASGIFFTYLVNLKSDWLKTLKLCINENGKSINPKVVELRYLLTDYATEVHGLEFTDFLRDSKRRQ